ncbi:AAA family ATPase [Sphingomonas sp. Leaf34]|uniref:AAA family ATPase n=1 Tax=Sphingomonas sp. Leaf34 TaxID=1736216 RepID=UPI0009EC8199|nr:AAA family ATPase [Sphingomonas sp. Leaf34]
MYLRKFQIENIRSIDNLTLDFDRGHEAGWHVILGSNGSGKSSVVRSLALLCMGEKEAYAARQDFSRWLRRGAESAKITGTFSFDRDFDTISGGGYPSPKPVVAEAVLTEDDNMFSEVVNISYSGERVNRTIWGSGAGWFSASFGPFRRFTGGDRLYDRLFVSNRRLAPHLTALGEDVALTEALTWLTSLHIQSLQDEKNKSSGSHAQEIMNLVKNFINNSGFLPHNAKIEEVTNEYVFIKDGNDNYINLESLSDDTGQH